MLVADNKLCRVDMKVERFTSHLPAGAVPYCVQLCQDYGFQFTVAKARKTKLGDFRALPTGQTHITVNADLNPYAFLITFIHEVAHADVLKKSMLKQRKLSRPHGKVWQQAFQRLMNPLLCETIFPASILVPLQEYMRKPAASTYANPALIQALRQIDNSEIDRTINESAIPLRDIQEGQLFRFQQKTYVRGTLRRTRVVCKEVSSAKSYVILAHAWVEKI